MSLTDTLIRQTKPQQKAIKLFDGRGLFLLVTPTPRWPPKIPHLWPLQIPPLDELAMM